MGTKDFVKNNLAYKKNQFLRKCSALSVVFIYLFIGLPVWYHLTKVDQYELEPLMKKEKLRTPYLFKENVEIDEFLDEISVTLPVNLNLTNTYYKFPDLIQSTQKELTEMLERYKNEYKFNNLNLNIDLKEAGNKTAEHFYQNKEYLVQLEHTDHMGNSISLYEKLEIIVQYNDESVYSNYLPTLIANSIVNHFFFDKIEVGNEFDRYLTLENKLGNLKYKPTIKLAFNLIVNKNILAGWDLNSPSTSSVIQNLFAPFTKMFEGIYKFKVETNILYNEDLKLETWSGEGDDIEELQSQLDVSRLIDNELGDPFQEKLLNFVVVLPENKHLVSDADEIKFLSYNLPEWGSVFVYRDLISSLGSDLDSIYLSDDLLEPIFYQFLKQIFPNLAGSDNGEEDEKITLTITNFMVKATLNNIFRANKNIRAVYDMLHSLPVVTDESLNEMIPEELQPYLENFMNKFFPSLSIPQKIHDQLVEVITRRDYLLKKLAGNENVSSKFAEYLHESFALYKLSDETFFDHEMVMGNYKSLKHIIAVYLPLLGPVCSIAVGGAIHLLKAPKKDPLLKSKKQE
ncbi:hypothetical protein QEN19_001075 [Hanseniaspora menglaensis]